LWVVCVCVRCAHACVDCALAMGTLFDRVGLRGSCGMYLVRACRVLCAVWNAGAGRVPAPALPGAPPDGRRVGPCARAASAYVAVKRSTHVGR